MSNTTATQNTVNYLEIKKEALQSEIYRIERMQKYRKGSANKTDDERRLRLSNSVFQGLAEPEHYPGTVIEDDIDPMYKLLTLRKLAKNDELSRRIVKYIDTTFGDTTVFFDNDADDGDYNKALEAYERAEKFLEACPVAAKLVLRTMTESEYMGYLNGESPIAEDDDVLYLLPKKD